MKNSKSELNVQVMANSLNSYSLEDIYSAYFSSSPRLPVSPPSDATQRLPEPSRSNDLPEFTIIFPDNLLQESRGLVQRSAYSIYRDSPILNNVSRSLTSLDLPPSSSVYIWDPRSFQWHVLAPENQWVLQSIKELHDGEDSARRRGPQRRQVSHNRHASEPLASLKRGNIKQSSSLRRIDDKRDDAHPTWEFALRYAEPSPLVFSFEAAGSTPTTATPFSDTGRRLFVQILGAFNLTYLSQNNYDRSPYASISIAGQQVSTPFGEQGSIEPVWNSEFIFESVKDADPVAINVWNVEDLTEQPTLQGSFVCTVRRLLLMQSMNDVLTLTLDRWPDEANVLESIQCGSIVLRIQDLTPSSVPEFPTPFARIENIPRREVSQAKYNFQSSSYEASQDNFEQYISIPYDSPVHQDRIVTPPSSTADSYNLHPRWFTDIVGRTLSLTKGRYPWVPTGNITIVDGPVCGGRYCDIYIGELQRHKENTKVGLKQLRVFVNASDDMRKMFCREVRFWSQLRHPNVLPFWGCWELDEYRLFMISPWAAHGNSLEYVRKNPTVDRRRILQQTAEALSYLHSGEHGPAVVHGDLKADNVLVSGSGDALLADFGLTRYVEKLAVVSGTPSGLSAHGHIRFSAPELLYPQPGQESRPTPESDVFAFGCFLVQLYTEELPFSEIKAEAHLITEIIKGRTPMRPAGPAVKRGLDDSLWAIASTCWRFDASQRPDIARVANKLRLTRSYL